MRHRRRRDYNPEAVMAKSTASTARHGPFAAAISTACDRTGGRFAAIMTAREAAPESTAGRPALHGREPGQVRKEAATAILCKCRGNGSLGRRPSLRDELPGPRPQVAAPHVRRARRAGARRHGAHQRADARTPASRVSAHRHARRRQDDDRAHPRQEPQLRDRRHGDAVRRVQRVPRHRRRPLRRPARARRRVEHRHRQHARDPRQRALCADGGPLQGLPDRRSAHAVEGRVQLDAEDARGAARAREVRPRDDRSAEDSRSPCCRAACSST